MQVKITGSNIDLGSSIQQYVNEQLEKAITKFISKIDTAEVYFGKQSQLFFANIIINEAVKKNITIKANGEAGDIYGAFNEALKKAVTQLKRYKNKLHDYHKESIKNLEPKYFSAIKYVLPPFPYNIFEEMEQDATSTGATKHQIVSEKNTTIEELSVDDAIMKMDLANLPALVFINSQNKRLNVVYHRKDGQISLVDPQI
ncbi:MAG: ribosome-associated translation inhibitor RaiA [Proteobacteria bacterium]|jgi:ribosomal subunit interface protein|nr:ribosome-associated translation inhibitor RaiA [Pseudomonadota bacterium]